MKPITLLALICVILACAACTPEKSEAAQTIEVYLQALVDKDETRLVALTCPDYEMDALLELDAFQNVVTTLEGLACEETGTEGDYTLVNCEGQIMASYGAEQRQFDLSERTYRLLSSADGWLVCGD
ncbi:MAG TPA: hypothetical protein PKH92_05135 [Anaerolineaceae bacterium]|nr:hypothetical protein [Anaerolineaceae bacterium]HOG78316.1 hypothetical protein [Anaerolineaceae bacterium]HQN42673.1 hypothetical protein [Anaerolineaceae bacterium]